MIEIEIREGWQCPYCKRIWNPDIQVCTCQVEFPIIDRNPYEAWLWRDVLGKYTTGTMTYKPDPKRQLIVKFYQE